MPARINLSSVLLLILLCAGFAPTHAQDAPMVLRAAGVPDGNSFGPAGESLLRTIAAFESRHPDVSLRPATGISIPGHTMDLLPLMQIAGDVSPDVLYVNFRQSETYIRNKFLYPVDVYLESKAGLSLPNGHLLSTPKYMAALRQGAGWPQIESRIPRLAWDVIRRECPYGTDCPYLQSWHRPPAATHAHVWCLPEGQKVIALSYRRDMLAETGLPDRAPADYDEFLAWARKMTNPRQNRYGFSMSPTELGYTTLSILYSFGGRAVEQDTNGVWRCVFDSEAAVNAYYYVARLFLEPFDNEHGHFLSVVDIADRSNPAVRHGLTFAYIDPNFFNSADPNLTGFGPVPKGPTGLRGSEFNCSMFGLYAGNLDHDARKRDIAWEYMWFFGGEEANQIQARVFVGNGLGRFVRPDVLRKSGYAEYVSLVPAGWDEATQQALDSGVPEPYGRNCDFVYHYMSMGIDQIRNDPAIREAILAGQADIAKDRIREILHARVALANEKMLGLVPPDVRRFRQRVAASAVALIVLIFVFVFRRVMRTFSHAAASARVAGSNRARSSTRHAFAYLMLLPALLSIAIWAYYPLLRGTLMAFQDYNVRGFTHWIGFDNFASVLFNHAFWYALGVSVEYTALFMLFGFVSPILLALLLTEVPRGKILYRTIYYLPAVLSGVVVIFLWKGFYGPYGMINQVLNAVLHAFNAVCGTHCADVVTDWLTSPRFALFFCLLPSIWAGMGPGCLIYLAALKTIPEDLYEAADIDGASARTKVLHITLPSIKSLIAINFIGAIIGAMHSGSQFVLVMTGGGPYAPFGQTEVIGLHIFWEAFGFLRFGVATAMAWVLGSMLIGFTVLQLQRLSRMEFKTADKS